MRLAGRVSLCAAVAIAVAGYYAAESPTTPDHTTAAGSNTVAGPTAAHTLPSASVDDEPLLLLDHDTSGAARLNPDATGADNSRCEVCHLNLMQEELVTQHARTNIGCVRCHGNCDAHIADESWASGGNGTPPEIMYPREKIGPSCLECHKPERVFLESEKHRPEVWLIAYEVKTCTDCHGQHRMPNRKCKWK